ncbi:pentaheme c-type cytochrome TorC [Buttiauxella brennerae]|uniref:pentaheme c-type cytochrome TorC n=1 Tax=Buttiauxella brennerae TaxID=82988 RepID=UPI00286F0AB5|nr:pentaheme c-type cytochrome TorC [Buttiauxella brennerae]
MSWIRKKTLWLVVAGALGMLAIIWGTVEGIHQTSTTEFCLSCHSMSTVGKEYKLSSHFKNGSGVRAECKDCHIPPGVIPTLMRKTEAVNDLWSEFVSPSINTPEKFAAKRGELAQREWKRMTANNSAGCKSCHSFEAMDHSKQSSDAADKMSVAALNNGNCIDCHKGIAHQKPDTSTSFRSQYQALQHHSGELPDSKTLYSLGEKALTATFDAPAGKAILMPATQVTLLKEQGDKVQIQIIGWRETEGRGRVITQYPGKRVFSAVLDPSLVSSVKVLATQIEPASKQEWQQISVSAWTTKEGFNAEIEPVWQYAEQMLQSTCTACHTAPATTRFNANGWIAGLKAMSAYYRLSPQEERTLLKYLQTHASDTSDTNKTERKEP